MNTLEFDRLLLRLKKADTDEKKAVIFRDLAEEAEALSDSLTQQDSNYVTPFIIRSDGSF